MKHLWEIDHPYYCNLGNYFSNECTSSFKSWQEFIAAEGDVDLDMNLVFRFDFEPPWEDGDSAKPIRWQGDTAYRDCTLKLFYIGQRKGLFRSVEIQVCRADEKAIKEWLQPRYDHLKLLWEPLL